MKQVNEIINKIHVGHVLDVLREFPDDIISCVMTSPPYWGLRAYGTEPQVWGGDVACQHEWVKKRTARPNASGGKTGFLKSKGKDNYSEFADYHDRATYSDYCSQCNAWRGELGLENTIEEFIGHLCDVYDEIRRVMRPDGTCWVNLGTTIVDKCDTMIPERFAFEMINRGWIKRRTKIWWKPNVMPGSQKDDMTGDFEYVYLFVKRKDYWFEQQFEELSPETIDDIMKRKNLDCLTGEKGSKHFENDSSYGQQKTGRLRTDFVNPIGRNMRSVWKIQTQPMSEAHFAVYPEELCIYPIKAGCPEFICQTCGIPKEKIFERDQDFRAPKDTPGAGKYIDAENKILHGGGSNVTYGGINSEVGKLRYEFHLENPPKFKGYTSCDCKDNEFKPGIVLDPFVGSGTTCLVADNLGRRWVGIELSPDYAKIAKKRLERDGSPLFRELTE